MTTSEKAKEAGFQSLTELAEMFKTTTETLRQYDKNRAKFGCRFDIILLGGVVVKLKLKGELNERV